MSRKQDPITEWEERTRETLADADVPEEDRVESVEERYERMRVERIVVDLLSRIEV